MMLSKKKTSKSLQQPKGTQKKTSFIQRKKREPSCPNSKTSVSPSSGCAANAALEFDNKNSDSTMMEQIASKTPYLTSKAVTKTTVTACAA